MNNNSPFFSVIIPAFNSAAFIRKGLDSIKNQSFQDFELIVVCDKCEDNTAEVAREYTDNVFEVDHDIDGPGSNKGLDVAQGEWILFMDDDDWYLHEFAFEMLADAIKELSKGMGFDILAYGFIMKGIGYQRNTPQHLWPAVWNKCWRREFIGDTRFPDWAHSNDLGFAMATHQKARIAYWDMPFYYYNYMRPGCVSEKIKNGEYDGCDVPDFLKSETEKYKAEMKDGTLSV